MADLIDEWRTAEDEARRAEDRATTLRRRLKFALASKGPVRCQHYGKMAFDGEALTFGGSPADCPDAASVQVPDERRAGP